MTTGTITKLVTTFGSSWGRIGVSGRTREVFFNLASLKDPHEFAGLHEGQAVEFDEIVEAVNRRHATAMTIRKAEQVNR